MTEISLGDVSNLGEQAAEEAATEAAGEVAAGDENTGEWMMELVDRLDDKGLLEPILFGKDGAIPDADASVADQAGEGGGEGGSKQFDADTLASIGKKVIDQAGDLQISQIVQLAEQHPDRVNAMIEEEMN